MIKETICSMVASLMLATNVAAIEVGEKMPDIDKTMLVSIRDFVKGGKNIIVAHTHDLAGCAYDGVYIACNGVINMTPFGIYDFKENKLYLDNAPIDGVVDKIIDNARGKGIAKYAPDCI